MSHKVNKERLGTALLVVPLVVIVIMFAVFLVLILTYTDSDGIEGIMLPALYGLYLSYPIMFLFGLPMIVMVEKKRPKKTTAVTIYVLIAILTSVLSELLFSFLLLFPYKPSSSYSSLDVYGHYAASFSFLEKSEALLKTIMSIEGVIFLAVAGCFAGLLTSLIMLLWRKDWYASNAPSVSFLK